MNTARLLRFAVLVTVIVTGARGAAAGDWTLRLFGAVVEPSGDTRVVADQDGLRVALQTAAGGGLAISYGVSSRWSLELGVLFASSGIDLGIDVSPPTVRVRQGLGMAPLSLGVYWTATPGDRIQLYLGPQLALVRYSSVELEAGSSGLSEELHVDSDLGLGALIGIDVPFGSTRWVFNATARYLATSADPEGPADSVRVNPFILTAGVGVRW